MIYIFAERIQVISEKSKVCSVGNQIDVLHGTNRTVGENYLLPDVSTLEVHMCIRVQSDRIHEEKLQPQRLREILFRLMCNDFI